MIIVNSCVATFSILLYGLSIIDKPDDWIAIYRQHGGIAKYDNKGNSVTIYSPEKGNLASLLFVPRLKNINTVHLVGSKIRDDDVSAAMKWPGVSRLELTDCSSISDKIFSSIKSSQLKELFFQQIPVSAQGVSELSGSKTLQIINISSTSDVSGELNLHDMKSLRILELVSFKLQSVILKNNPSLENIFSTVNIDAAKLAKLELIRLPLLQEAEFNWAPITTLIISKCEKLHEIRINKSKLTTDQVKNIIKDNPSLKIRR